jgi:hypothetical protein
MRIGLGRQRSAFVLAVTLVITILVAASANAYQSQPTSSSARPGASSIAFLSTASSSPARSKCDRPFSSTLVETSKVRVYAMPKESTSQPEHRDPAIGGRPVFGCLKTTGEPRLLDLPEVSGEKHAYWVEVHSSALAVSAPLVAYAYTQYYLDTHQTWIRVRNLRTGRVIRSCLVGGAIAPSTPPHVPDIVLGPGGAVGWNAEGEGAGGTELPTPGCNPTG